MSDAMDLILAAIGILFVPDISDSGLTPGLVTQLRYSDISHLMQSYIRRHYVPNNELNIIKKIVT